jgi:hypothetical protein
MGNPFRGEAELKVGDATYKLVIDINAMIEAGEASGLDTQALLDGVDRNDFKAIAAIFYGALRRHHDDVHPVQAREIMSDAGIADATKLVTMMLMKAFPPAKGREAPGKPRRAAAGTG